MKDTSESKAEREGRKTEDVFKLLSGYSSVTNTQVSLEETCLSNPNNEGTLCRLEVVQQSQNMLQGGLFYRWDLSL